MTTAWAHLPNATHIDRVQAHLKQHPDRWEAARGAARGAAWGAARGAALDAAWEAARGAALDAAWGAALDAVWGVARGAVVALIAWDDCAYLLDQTPELLQAQINLVGDRRAVLLLPAVVAMRETP